ncbi:hypothetical protein LN042_20365 [Kitasatospora sp. RB6PN24]|uniref:hypothetical protein n=1 Tax=Kitasatospora humi TaxID=2893891 RepID=UPI001E569993|nr:hypothetical protein [Kitasatospora humi]MCC9309407.1 hypothetical protein [Kitasatospora humi]
MTTDQKHPDGDGAGGGPLEQLVREALAARAQQIGVHDLRPAAPPNRRPRRLKPVYAAVLPLGLAAAVTIGFVGFRSSTVADRAKPVPAASITESSSAKATPSSSPSPSPSGSTSPSSSTSTSASPDAAGGPPSGTASGSSSATATSSAGDAPAQVPVSLGAVQSYRGVKFQPPSGWTVHAGSAGGNSVCLAAPDPRAAAGLGGCGPDGIALTVYTTTDEAGQAYYPRIDSVGSSQGWDQQSYCYDPQNPHDDSVTVESHDTSSVSLPAGSAEQATWKLDCSSGAKFTAQMWGFRQAQVLVAARGLDQKYQGTLQAFLNSLDLGGHQAPVSSSAVAFTVSGLGQPVPLDGTKVPFSVTFTNGGSVALPQVSPQVGLVQNTGSLEEQLDDGSWISLPAPTDFAGFTPNPAVPVFPLAAGAGKTVNYRVALGQSTNGSQPSLVERAWLVFPEGNYSKLGTTTVPVPTAAK